MTASPSRGTTPLLSVVLLSDGGAGTAATLDSLGRQDRLLDDVEILVAGAAPTVSIPAAVAAAAVRLVKSSPDDRGLALGAAIREAAGAYVTVLEAGDRATTDLLRELCAAAAPDRVVIALTAPSPPSSRHVPVGEAAAVLSSLVGSIVPAGWCANVTLPAGIEAGLGATFHGLVLAPFARRFGRLDARPARRGAAVVPGPGRNRPDTFAARVTEPLRVSAALCAGFQHDPADRAPLTTALVAAQLAHVSAYRLAHPDEEGRVRRAIADTGVPGLGLTGPGGWTWPDLDVLMGGDHPAKTRLVVVAGATAPANARFRELTLLRRAGTSVDLAFLTGSLDDRARGIPHHRIKVMRTPKPLPRHVGARTVAARARRKATRYWEAARRIGVKAAPRLLPTSVAVARAHTHDRKTMELLARADLVVALDADGAAFALSAGATPAPASTLAALVLAAGPTVAPLGSREALVLARSASELRGLATGDPLLPPPQVWAMVAWRLYRSSRLDEALTLVDACLHHHPDAATRQGLALFPGLVGIVLGGNLTDELLATASAVAAAADEALDEGELDRAAFLASLVAEALLHGDLQANVAAPPLVTDPERLLAPLVGSRTWGLLTAPLPVDALPSPAAERSGGGPRVLVLPGTYPKFVGGILDALSGRADTRVLGLASMETRFGASGVSPREIGERLRRTLEQPVGFGGTVGAAFRDRDVVFADWADKGAVLASMLAPRGCRLIVRFHGVDSLSVWQFLVDWSRVTDVVFVSEHLRRTVNATLGARIAHARQHVAGNVVEVAHFSAPSIDGASRTLGMVGWGQKVKDPLWTLDLLASLRRHDPAWRLVLVGRDFPARAVRPSERAYAQAFRERAAQPDLVQAIEYVGHSRDLPRHLQRIGFAVSSSFRESFHIGAVEMVAAGAVPVFRDWPVYAAVGGARGLFPEEWIVDSVVGAQERILSLADPDAWAAASASARAEVRDRFSADTTSDLYRRIILGS